MKILVVGAAGKTGTVLVKELLAKGHEVTAFARRPQGIDVASSRLRRFQGDAMTPADLCRAMRGQEAVAITLGITENPLLVRLRGTRRTHLEVRSRGTKNTIAAMRAQGVRKLVVQTTYGIGESKGRLSFKWRLLFSMFLKPQILDSEVQERVVRDSGLDWTLVQPVALTDDADAPTFVSTDGEAQKMNVSRASVARVIADALESAKFHRASVSISAPRAPDRHSMS